VTAARLPDIVAAFHAVHERVYGYARAQQPAEFVNFRAVHTFPLPAPVVRSTGRATGTVDEARVSERPAYFAPGGFVATAIYDRARLPEGAVVNGPAIIEQMDTTIVIPPGYAATVDSASNLRIRRK
jgi:N-methylhydantoinase A